MFRGICNKLLWSSSALCILLHYIGVSTSISSSSSNLIIGIGLAVVAVATAYYQEYMTSNKFLNTNELRVVCLRDGQKLRINAEELTLGDIIEIKGGDKIPADIRILEAQFLKVDNSNLTGESGPKALTSTLTHEHPLETSNLGFCSTFVVEGIGKALVVNIGHDTVIGQLRKQISSITPARQAQIEKEIAHFVNRISVAAIIIGVASMATALSLGHHWLDAVMCLVGIVISFLPKGLSATVTASMTIAARRLAAKNCLVKNIMQIETLGSTSVICCDKTGTLTQNKMTVSHFWFDNKIIAWDIQQPDILVSKALIRAAALCSRAEFKPGQDNIQKSKREVTGDATEAALLRCCERILGNVMQYRSLNIKVYELPFNSVNKYQLSIHKHKENNRFLLVMKGTPERILESCSTIYTYGEEVEISDEWKYAFNHALQELGGIGERVLGFADCILNEKQVNDFQFGTVSGLRFIGLISLLDPPRPTVPDAIAKCHSAGIKVVMFTGDHPVSAKAIAKSVGIISEEHDTAENTCLNISAREAKTVIHGSELYCMSSDTLTDILMHHSGIVFAKTSPIQKLSIVQCCQQIGAVVAVIGNGVSDVQALKQADVGISMNTAGTEIAKDAADIILLDDDFASIVLGIEEGRVAFDNIKKSIAYTLTSNVSELLPFVIVILADIPLPLSVITIFCIDLGTDILPGISMAYERPEFGIMKRMPRNGQIYKLFSLRLVSVTCGMIGMIQAVSGFFVYLVIMAENGFWPSRLLGLRRAWDSPAINDLEDSYKQEWTYKNRKVLEYTCHTAFFVSIVVVQWANLIICKTRKNSVFQQGMDNWVMNFGLFFETALAAFLSYTPGMDKGLKMYPLKINWWFPGIPFSILIFVIGKISKWILQRYPGGWFQREVYY